MFPYTYSDLYLLRILIPELLIQKELISKIKFGCSQGLTSLVREEDLDSVPNPRYGNCKHLLSLKVRSVSLDSILYSLFLCFIASVSSCSISLWITNFGFLSFSLPYFLPTSSSICFSLSFSCLLIVIQLFKIFLKLYIRKFRVDEGV